MFFAIGCEVWILTTSSHLFNSNPASKQKTKPFLQTMVLQTSGGNPVIYALCFVSSKHLVLETLF